MKVAVGSTNPVKILSTKQAFQAVWPNEKWIVEGISVKSGVADQPMSDGESIKGATTRAKKRLSYFMRIIGLMTKNIITRTSGYKDGIVMALVRFIHPDLFKI